MKQILVIISALALGFSVASAQGGIGGGEGPHGHTMGPGGMWSSLGDLELPPEMVPVRDAIIEARTALRLSREAAIADLTDPEEIRAALAEWKTGAEVVAQFTEMRQNIETLRAWFRENRPDRPDPVDSNAMVQRREQFRENTQNIHQTREQLRQLDPDADHEPLRTQLRNLLQERKQLLRSKRNGEGAPGGEGGRRG